MVYQGYRWILVLMEFSGIFDASLSVNLRMQPFLLAPRSQGRFARRKVCDSATEIPYWWRRPIRAPLQIPDRFYFISMEFLSLSRRRSSWRNVLSGGARRNGCIRMLMIRLILDHKNQLIPKERTPISGCRCFTFFAVRFSWRADQWPNQHVHLSNSFPSVSSGKKRKSLESIIWLCRKRVSWSGEGVQHVYTESWTVLSQLT